MYPYTTQIKKNGNVIEDKIDIYSWMTLCPKATGGMPR
jgi:hypothetical protein